MICRVSVGADPFLTINTHLLAAPIGLLALSGMVARVCSDVQKSKAVSWLVGGLA